MFSTRSLGQLARVDQLGEGPPGVERADDDVGVELGAVGQRDADALPSLVITASTGGVEQISAPKACAARASTWVKPPLPPLWNAHDPKWPSCSPSEW